MNTEKESSAVEKPTFDDTVLKAAKAVYANTESAQRIPWDLLPRNAQDEIQTVARIAITVALKDLYVAVGGARKVES